MPKARVLALAAIVVLTLAGGAVASRVPARAATSLVRGWNNIAYTGSSAPPSEALAPLAGQYNAVYRWNTASQTYELFSPNLPAFANSITSLNEGDAIWVDVSSDSAQWNATARTGRLAIAASTFVPASDLAIYEKTFNQLSPVGTDEASQRYFAPVILPDGATITSMTAAFAASGGDVRVRLDYTPLANGSNDAQVFKLVEVLSTAGASPQTSQAFTHTINNTENVYFLVVDLTGGPGTKLHGVSVAYTGG
jgi:hypothetical protein